MTDADKKLADAEARYRDLLAAVIRQRDAATNRVAELEADYLALQRQLAAANAPKPVAAVEPEIIPPSPAANGHDENHAVN